MAQPLIHSGLVSMGPRSHPNYVVRITFELGTFEAQLGLYTSNLV